MKVWGRRSAGRVRAKGETTAVRLRTWSRQMMSRGFQGSLLEIMSSARAQSACVDSVFTNAATGRSCAIAPWENPARSWQSGFQDLIDGLDVDQSIASVDSGKTRSAG